MTDVYKPIKNERHYSCVQWDISHRTLPLLFDLTQQVWSRPFDLVQQSSMKCNNVLLSLQQNLISMQQMQSITRNVQQLRTTSSTNTRNYWNILAKKKRNYWNENETLMQQMKTKGTTPTFWRSVSAFKNNCQNNLLVATFETTLASSSAGPYLAGRGWPTTITWLLQTHRSQPWLLRPRHHQIRRVWWQSRISRCSMELEGDASVWAPVTATRAKYWQREREREAWAPATVACCVGAHCTDYWWRGREKGMGSKEGERNREEVLDFCGCRRFAGDFFVKINNF